MLLTGTLIKFRFVYFHKLGSFGHRLAQQQGSYMPSFLQGERLLSATRAAIVTNKQRRDNDDAMRCYGEDELAVRHYIAQLSRITFHRSWTKFSLNTERENSSENERVV